MKILKTRKNFPLLFMIALLMFFMSSNTFLAQKELVPTLAPINPDFLNPPAVHFGLKPHRADISHIGVQYELVTAVPSAWDWRTAGGVTSVKNQESTCGSCWAFASIADLESLALIFQNTLYDFSEENLKECNYWGFTCSTGGHAYGACNYFTKGGARLESCDPYHAWDTSCNTACSPIETVTGWRLVPNDVTSIKSAVYQYGPCYSAMNASTSGFSTYDGSYCIYDPTCSGTNHAVLIVGWDDSMSHGGGTGGWIVKNSWGTSWGDSGYFYIAYDSACIGQYTSYYRSKKSYCSHEKLYYYDDAGWDTSAGWSGYDYAHGLVEFTPSEDDCLTHIDFWAVDDNMTCDINIYDDFNGTNVSNLLHSQTTSCPEAGYYSVELTTPLCVETGEDIFIDINFNTTSYNWPVPIDQHSPIESNKCYISLTGASGTWFELGSSGLDIGIRARGGHRHKGMVAADLGGDGNHELVFDDGSSGIGYWGSPWNLLSPDNPEYMIAANIDGDGDDEIIVDFGSMGLWWWNGSWSRMTPDNPEYMIAANIDGSGGDEIIVDFGSVGLWSWNGSWSYMTSDNPEYMIAANMDGDGDDEIIVDFGSMGLWWWNGSWSYMTSDNPEYMVSANIDGSGGDEIIVDFGSIGLWSWNGSWSYMTGDNPEYMIAANIDGDGDDEIVTDFASKGLWLWNGSWSYMTGDNPEYMIAANIDGDGDDEVVGDFSAVGVWYWNAPGPWNHM